MDVDNVREKLEQRLRDLREERSLGQDARKTMELDQTAIGRLSRMDALQVQAMAEAVEARRQMEIRRIGAALKRIEEDDFGYCVKCGNEIAEARLTVDLTTLTCIKCATAREGGR